MPVLDRIHHFKNFLLFDNFSYIITAAKGKKSSMATNIIFLNNANFLRILDVIRTFKTF